METNTAQQDLSVIRQVLAGRSEAFRCLVQRHERPVFQLVRNLVTDVHQAEDIAQEVFLAAYRNLEQFDYRRGAFRTWLLTIARNKCWDTLQKKRPVVSPDLPPPLDCRTPEDECIYREFLEDLDIALEELSLDLRTTFVLSEFGELSTAEIAEIEGVKSGTVRARLSRAKQHLRSRLDAYTERAR